VHQPERGSSVGSPGVGHLNEGTTDVGLLWRDPIGVPIKESRQQHRHQALVDRVLQVQVVAGPQSKVVEDRSVQASQLA
jgi:hypothetical protein